MQSQTRRPRFNRIKDVPAIQLTERDLLILHQVARHRFLRSTHVVALMNSSRQQVLRRLQLLFHHGYLERPRSQIDYYRSGSNAMVYGIGNRGALLIEERCGIPRRKVDWSVKNRTVNRFFMEHTLAVADVMIAFEVSSKKQGTTRVVAMESATDDLPKWTVNLKQSRGITQLPVIPDKIFRIDFANRPDASIHVLLEVDRATMPVIRQSLKQTSVYRKFLGYQQVWREKLHVQFGMNRIRVLTVTTTPERVMNLVEAAQQLRESTPGLFLFTHAANIALNANALDAGVVNVSGNEVQLIA